VCWLRMWVHLLLHVCNCSAAHQSLYFCYVNSDC
jgi:hypothetical protein